MSTGGPQGPDDAALGQASRMSDIDEVSRQTVVKCMGRTFSAVAVDGEVVIADVTDITRPVRLGVARGRCADGRWRIVGRHERDLLTTASMLSAAGYWAPVNCMIAR